MNMKKTETAEAVDSVVNAVPAGDRYISSKVDRPLGHVLVMGGMALGGYLAFTHAGHLVSSVGLELNMLTISLLVAAGALLGNLAGQVVSMVATEVAKPFVPGSWIA